MENIGLNDKAHTESCSKYTATVKAVFLNSCDICIQFLELHKLALKLG